MAWDTIWEEVFKNRPWGKYPGEDLIRFVARNFYKAPNRRDIKLLEVGCGTGSNLWYMAREGFTVYGVEGSETAAKIAVNRLDDEVPGWSGRVIVQDMTSLPFDQGYFDAVIDNQATSCNSYEDSQRIYAEMARVTKEGGALFSRTFAKGCWGDETGEPAGRNAWIVAAGPLFNLGLARFTEYGEIPDLIKDFQINEIELITRSMESQRQTVKEWVITAIKK